MIVGERDVHHGPDGNSAIARHSAVLNGVQPQYGALWRIDNRRGEQRAVNSAIGNRERVADGRRPNRVC